MLKRPRSEVELLQASLKGSSDAFAAIVAKYQSVVCAITYSATGNIERSEELAQEAFVRAWENLAQLKDPTKFRAWLSSIARSIVRNWFRREKRDIIAKAVSMDYAENRPSEDSGPVDAVMRKEQQAVVSRALSQVPEIYREPLVLFYREQKSIRQVAEQLELSESAARQRVSRGRSMLKEHIAALVESTIARTAPGKAFTAAVVASIAGMAVKGSSAAAAAAAGATAATSTNIGIRTVMSGIPGKIVTVAVGLAVAAGALITYKQITGRAEKKDLPEAAGIVGEKEAGQDKQAAPTTEITDAKTTALQEEQTRLNESIASIAGVQTASEYATDGRMSTSPRKPITSETDKFEFKPRGVLSGLITDSETAEPVADATVRIIMGSAYEAETDANGFYFFDKISRAGNYAMVIDSKDYVGISSGEGQPVLNLTQDKQVIRHFQLPRGCLVDVRVANEDGAGIEGATVVVTSQADARARDVGYFGSYFGGLRETKTGGHILLGGLKPADTDYLITAWHKVKVPPDKSDGRMYRRSKYDYALGRLVVRLTDPNVIEQAELVLKKGVEVSGYAQYADGAAATDVEIIAQPSWWHCNYMADGYETDDNGRFTLEHIAPGAYKIFFYFPREESGGGTYYSVMQTQLPPDNNEPLVVHLPGKSAKSLASISGTLIFAGEKKPMYVSIDAYSPTAGYAHTRLRVGTNRDGDVRDDFVLGRLEPARYRLMFSGENVEQKVLEDVEAPSEGLEVELVYSDEPKLEGIVVDSKTREPVRQFRARARKLQTLRGPHYVQQERWTYFMDEKGQFSIDVVGPGIYEVQAVAEGYAPGLTKQINTDEMESVVLELQYGGSIRGKVVDEQGMAISGAKVIPLSKACGSMPHTKDLFVCQEGAVETLHGDFTLKNLPAGMETLKVTHPDYAFSIVENIEVVGGKTSEGIEIVLTKGGTVEGYVYDMDGIPQAGVVLYFQDARGYSGGGDEEAGRLGTVVTDSNGFYRASGLPEKMCYVKRKEEWSSLGVVCRAIAPQNARISRLDFGGTPILTGTAVIDGEPLPDRRVLLGPTDSPHVGMFKCYTRTDWQGRFAFRGAAAGRHAIYYEQPEKRNEWVKIATVEIRDRDLDVGAIPREVSQLLVTISEPGSDSKWKIENVHLSEVATMWTQPIRISNAPSAEGGPWIIANVEAGKYMLAAVRQDQIQIRKEIELVPTSGRWQITVDIPNSTARLCGRILGDIASGLILWREGKDILGTILPGNDGAYSIENLPPGRYSIGGILSLLSNVPSVAEFELHEGQSKILDIDLSSQSADNAAHLLVLVAGEDGQPRGDAVVWLEGRPGTIQPCQSTQEGYVLVTSPGEYVLNVTAEGYKEVKKQIILKGVDPTSPKEQSVFVRLEKRRKLST